MANCRYCGTECPEQGEHDHFFDCALYTERKPTNGERIRAMSDEELAEFINDCTCDNGPRFCKDLPECDADLEEGTLIPLERCMGCLLAWLMQPAQEEE